MKTLALITARGGSKSIPKKNLVPLAGRPLLAYTCEAALGSASIDRVVLSTDDDEIAAVGRACGVEVPFMRPADLATDDARSIDVAVHALRWLEQNEGRLADRLVLLQPTSPLRTSRHIDEALAVMDETGADTVVSVVPVPHRFNPYSIMRLEGGRLLHFRQEPLPFDRFRRQDLPVLYARNGPAMLITHVPILLGQVSFYGGRTVPYVMNEAESVDVDSALDLVVAEAALQLRDGRGSGRGSDTLGCCLGDSRG